MSDPIIEGAPPKRRFLDHFLPRDRSGTGAAGLVTSLITTIVAFVIAGLVVLFTTGSNPLAVYRGIFTGTGLNWLFPWVSGDDRILAAGNLQQTLLVSTTLALTGLAVAFAFRCGLFNIGGQGQYIVGAIVSVWAGHAWAGMARPLHIILVILIAMGSAAVFAGIAGILKATVGAHEVISTIMLNWIAYWVGTYLLSGGGPLQAPDKPDPISSDIAESAKIPVFWGDAELQGLHIGFFVAIAALVVYWLVLSRTTLGFRVRAVGRNPEAARYGGIGVGKSYFLAMAISGAFAGLGGALDILGWQYRLGVFDVHFTQVGFIGIAVALLGRNTAVGIGAASLLFGALLYGTSTRSIDPEVFPPELAGNLTSIIQGLVLVFICADIVVLWIWQRRKGGPLRLPRLRRGPKLAAASAHAPKPTAATVVRARPAIGERAQAWLAAQFARPRRLAGLAGMLLAVLSFLVAVPPIAVRTPFVPIALAVCAAAAGAWSAACAPRRIGFNAIGLAAVAGTIGALATRSGIEKLDRVFVWSSLISLTLVYATPLMFAALGGLFSERSGVVNIGLEGMMLSGAFFGILAADKLGHWLWGVLIAMLAGGLFALLHALISIHWRADQIVSGVAINFLALGVTGYLFIKVYGQDGTPSGISPVPNVRLRFLDDVPLLSGVADANLLTWIALVMLVVVFVVVFRTPFGLRLRAMGEHPRAAETVGLSVYRTRYIAVVISGALAGLGGAFLSIGYVHSFNENLTAGKGFIALAALILSNWHPRGIFFGTLLIGFSGALALTLPVYSESAATLFQALPYLLVLVAVGGLLRRPRPPASVGLPYKRT